MFPQRCFTCNNFIGHKWDTYTSKKDNRLCYKDVLDELGLNRICCRRMFLSHVDIIDDVVMYSSVKSVMDESNTTFDAYVDCSRSVKCD